jgi:hypothetical protein
MNHLQISTAFSLNLFSSTAPRLRTTVSIYIFFATGHASYVIIFTEYASVFITVLSSGHRQGQCVGNSLTVHICGMNIILFTVPLCIPNTIGVLAVERSCPFAPPRVYLSDHLVVTWFVVI